MEIGMEIKIGVISKMGIGTLVEKEMRTQVEL